MNEKEQLLLKIQELEEENRKLKDMLPKEKAPSRSLCPEEIAEKYGGLMKLGIAREYNHFPFMDSNDLKALNLIIRRSCFLRVKKSSKKGPNSDCGKTLKELTDEEYAKYCEVLDKCIAIFKEYGNTENHNY